MVNFRIPALLFTFATGAMAAAFPRDVASPINEKSIVARDEITGVQSVHELDARGAPSPVNLLQSCVSGAASHVNNIKNLCKDKSTPPQKLAILLQADIDALVAVLGTLVAGLQVLASLNLTVSLSLLGSLLSALLAIFVDVFLALYVRVDLLGLLNLSLFVNVWVQIAIVLKVVVTDLGSSLISIAAGLGLTLNVFVALGGVVVPLKGYYY